MHVALPSANIRSEQNATLRTRDTYRHVVKHWVVTWVRNSNISRWIVRGVLAVREQMDQVAV